MDYIEKFIVQNKGKVVEMNATDLKFTTSFLLFTWETFAVIDKGIFTVKDGKISFKFYMTKLFIISSLMSFMAFLVTRDQNPYFGLLAFMVLCIGNWLAAINKCNNILDKIIYEIE